jgi:hypothetical protein
MMRTPASNLITRGGVVRAVAFLTLSLSLALVTSIAGLVGCGAKSEKSFPGDAALGTGNGVDGSPGSSGGPSGDGGGFNLGDGSGEAGAALDVEPTALQTITVIIGKTITTVGYTAKLNGTPANATWTLDRGDLGSIGAGPSSTATFTPTGATGGLVNIRVTAGGITVQRQVFIKLSGTSNGADSSAVNAPQIATSLSQLGSGGGVGGVGGEGLGGAVTDMPTLAALAHPQQTGSAQALTFLFPYNGTVWPRSMLAPLLQWKWTPPGGAAQDADAVQISLSTTSGSFSWTGTFATPAILAQSGGTFIRHPIPQDIWTQATNTAGGPTPTGGTDKLTVSLTIAKGGQGYGPITETWIVAPGRLEGTVYYNSYGTALVKNSIENAKVGGQFGAAVLGIKQGATSPVVVAGTPSGVGSGSGCRVCHVTASGGSTLIAQHGDTYSRTSAYNLKAGNAETVLTGYDGLFGWAGLSPDATLAFTNAADLAAGTPSSQLYAFPPTSNTPIPSTGIPTNLRAGTPVFSPDGKHIAFGFLGGTIGSTAGNDQMLAAMDFAPPSTDGGTEGGAAGTATFSNLKILVTMPSGERAGFPTFFPTNDAVAFHYQIKNSSHEYNTWNGAQAQIWWSDLGTQTAANLYTLNGLQAGGGTSYLPTGGTNHTPMGDTVMNYEPTASPVSSGGYIWVIFTSRRLYGNVATVDPYQSDPRNYDATQVANATTKKLWVAAIDLNAKPGTDASHPAFYLPAQELLAGNMRGFWVLNPCLNDSQSCSAGDQCCSGYCRSVEGVDAGLTCTTVPPLTSCANVGEKCAKASDCCDTPDSCINGFCSIPTPM